MDKYTSVVINDKFSKLSLAVANYPKCLQNWENLLDYLLEQSNPLNKCLDQRLYVLISSTYKSMLFTFPFLESYHIDYALFEYKMNKISKVHEIFDEALHIFNNRSLLIWVSYLEICNEIISDDKELFKKYATAERFIGLHYYSGDFWDLYLAQIRARCVSKIRFYVILRKVLEIPTNSFSKYHALWLQEINNIKDIKQLTLFVPKEDLIKKMKIDLNYKGRKGPYLIECKKKLKKFAKELYTVVHFQTVEIQTLFESKISIHYYQSPDSLLSMDQISLWENYMSYTIQLGITSLTHLNFQRALTVLSTIDTIWIKYYNWLVQYQQDFIFAKHILLQGLKHSIKKASIMKHLYSILLKLNDLDTLHHCTKLMENWLSGNHNVEMFEIFWDQIQMRMFLVNTNKQSRYSETSGTVIVQNNILKMILNRLASGERETGQELMLNYLIQLPGKENSKLIEEEIFKRIISKKIKALLESSYFWTYYGKLVFFDTSLSYPERRRKLAEIWESSVKFQSQPSESLIKFCQSYLPEDLFVLQKIFNA